MFLQLSDMIIHILFVSIPEAMFVVGLYLIVSNRFDLLELKPGNVARFFVPVLTISIATNFLRAYIPASVNYMPIISISIMYVTTILVYRILNSIDMLKIALSIIFSYLVGVIIQLSYVPLLLCGMNLNLSALNTYNPMTIVWTIPERVIEVCLIAYLVIKRKEVFKVNMLKEITGSRILTTATISIIILNLAFLWIMTDLICFNGLLENIAPAARLAIIALILVFPMLNMAFLWIVIYHTRQKESFEKLMNSERLKTLTNVLHAYASAGSYDKISLVLNDLKNHASQLYDEST